MACAGSSGCGCTCVCSCEGPRSYYGFGIWPAPRPIPSTFAFQPIVAVGDTRIQLVEEHRVVAATTPPGSAWQPPITRWGTTVVSQPDPDPGGWRATVVERGRGDAFLSPPPFEQLRKEAPGPVLYAPGTRTAAPPPAAPTVEMRAAGPTYDVGDPSGAIQSLSGRPVSVLAVAPPESRAGIEPPTPYCRAALAPPQAGEFLQGPYLGPGAGIGSEGSDPTEDNGRNAPMDSVVAEDSLPSPVETEGDYALEAPVMHVSPAALVAPSFSGHPMDAPSSVSFAVEGPGREASPKGPMPPPVPMGGGGEGLRPTLVNKPSIRPGFGLTQGRANADVQTAVAAGVREEAAKRDLQDRQREENRAIVKQARYEGSDLERAARLEKERQEAARRTDEAGAEVLSAGSQRSQSEQAAVENSHGDKTVAARIRTEVLRQDERHEEKLKKASAGSGDSPEARWAARRAELAWEGATEARDRANALSASTAGARQEDRVRRADAEVRRAETAEKNYRKQAAKTTDPVKKAELEAKANYEKDAAKNGRRVAGHNRDRLKDPKARKAYREQKAATKKAIKAAKKAAKEAKQAARRAKYASRYGPESKAKEAATIADQKRADAAAKQAEAEKAAGKLLDPESPPVGPPGGWPPPAKGGSEADDCACNPPCAGSAKCTCHCVPKDDKKESVGGSAGSLHPTLATVAPPDSGVVPPVPPPGGADPKPQEETPKSDEEPPNPKDSEEGGEEDEGDGSFTEEPTRGLALSDGSILIEFEGKVYHFPPEVALLMFEARREKGKIVYEWHIAKLKSIIERIGEGDKNAFSDFIRQYKVNVNLDDSWDVNRVKLGVGAMEAWEFSKVGLSGNPFTALALAAGYIGYGSALSIEDPKEGKKWVKEGLLGAALVLLTWGVAKYGPRALGRVKEALSRVRPKSPLPPLRFGSTSSAIERAKAAGVDQASRAAAWEDAARQNIAAGKWVRGDIPEVGGLGERVYLGRKATEVVVIGKDGVLWRSAPDVAQQDLYTNRLVDGDLVFEVNYAKFIKQ
jgi:hypothetical protein